MKYYINPDITKAETLPGRYYSDSNAFEIGKTQIFASSWQYIGDQEEIKGPGMVCPKVILPDILGEPVLLSRDLEDEIHCMSNVCTHRANLVVEQPGNLRKIRCRYHGRKFELNGEFESMPEFEDVKNFPREEDNLSSLELNTLGDKLFFTSIDPEMDFDEFIEPVRKRVSFIPMDEMTFDHSRSRDYLVSAHWVLYVDNYLEGFHIPYVHASLNEALDYGKYSTELYKWGNLQIGIAEGGEVTFDLPKDHPDAGKEVAAYYYWLWPNLMLNFYPWGLSLNLVQPLAIDRTKISFKTYAHRPDLLERGAGAGLDRVEREDEIVVENVAKGLQSRLYNTGRFSPKREKGVHQFHQLLAQYAE